MSSARPPVNARYLKAAMIKQPMTCNPNNRPTSGPLHQVPRRDRRGWPHRRQARTALLGAMALAWTALPHSGQAAAFAQENAAQAKMWPIVLTIFTAAFVIERVIEVVWNYMEWLLLNFRNWQPSALKTPHYLQFKSGTSLLVGAILGVLLANTTSMRLLDSLEPLAPGLLSGVADIWDIVITGLLIGAVAKPTHDILGILTQTKNFLGSSAMRQREAAGAELAEGVLRLAQSDAQSLIDVPGAGPTRLSTPLLDDEEGDRPADASSTTDYMEMLRNRTAM